MIDKFQFAQLGAYDFEKLILLMLQEEMGIGINGFGGSRDLGRDAYFEGDAKFPPNENIWSGVWIFQAKFRDILRRGEASCRSDVVGTLDDELNKIINKYEEPCDNYIYFTNVEMTVNDFKKMNEIAESYPINNFEIVHFPQITVFLERNPKVKWIFPRLIGITELDSLLNKENIERSKAFIDSIQSEIKVFVTTNVYFEALKILQKYNFVILEGPPKMGKTMIANAISLSKIPQEFVIYDISNPSDFFKSYKPEKNQIFICDDIFGAISYNPIISEEWVRDLSKILIRIKKTHQLVWSSRTMIFKEALQNTRLSEKGENIKPSEVIVEVTKLSKVEKANILYKHLKFSPIVKDNNKELIEELLKIKYDIINHPNFSPEVIRQLCSNILPNLPEEQSLEDYKREILKFLEQPEESWKNAFNSLPEEEKVYLITLFSIGSNKEREIFEKKFNLILRNMGKEIIGKFQSITNRLIGTYIRIKRGNLVAFYHPSIMDLIDYIWNEDLATQDLINEIGGSYALRESFKKRKITEAQKTHLIQTIINEDSLDEINESLKIVTKLHPQKINDNDVKFLCNWLCSATFYEKFDVRPNEFLEALVFLDNFEEFKSQISWIKAYLQKTFDFFKEEGMIFGNSLEILKNILEEAQSLEPVEFREFFRGNPDFIKLLHSLADEELDIVKDNYYPAEGDDFNYRISELNSILREFNFNHSDWDHSEEKKEYYENPFDEEEDPYRDFETQDEADEKIIDFMFDDLLE